MNVQPFQATWQGSTLKERSAFQEHVIDLCRLFGVVLRLPDIWGFLEQFIAFNASLDVTLFRIGRCAPA